MKEQLLIRDVTMVTFFNDGYNAIKIQNTDILLEDGFIKKIDRNIHEDCPTLCGTGKLAVPGLINGRSRSLAARVSKSIAEDMNFDKYGNTPIYTRVNPFLNIALETLSDEELAALIEPSLYEAAESGTTTLAEYCVGRELPIFLKLCEKYGLRTMAAPTLMSSKHLPEADAWGNFNAIFEEGADFGYEDKILEQNRTLVNQYTNHRTIHVCFGLGSADMVSEKLVLETVKAAEKMQVPLMISLNETTREWSVCEERYGLTPIEFFRKNHALCETTLLGGLTFVTDEDRKIMKSASCHAVVCQYQTMLDGVLPPFIEFLMDDINTVTGTGRCSPDMLAQLGLSVLAGKLQTKKRYQMQASDAFYAATQAGANALGIQAGRLEEGCVADMFLVNFENPAFHPLVMPVKELVYHTEAADISEVIIDGKIIKKAGTVLCEKRQAVTNRAEQAMEKVWMRARESGVL